MIMMITVYTGHILVRMGMLQHYGYVEAVLLVTGKEKKLVFVMVVKSWIDGLYLRCNMIKFMKQGFEIVRIGFGLMTNDFKTFAVAILYCIVWAAAITYAEIGMWFRKVFRHGRT